VIDPATSHGAAFAELLELLAADAPAPDFDAVVERARNDGWPADEVAALDRARLAALRIRERLEHRRRRETELSALFETAGDLARLRGADSVLPAIVCRTRQILGTDVAYLTLNDEARGDTYMRVTVGSVSPRFKALRLPMGAGLGGLVAQTAAAYATPNYFTDPRFEHTSEIDGAVAEEGLVAIVGVPLRLGERVIGVLFASDRSARPFEPPDVALISSLADHAAVAIDSARMLDETRQALSDLESTSRELQDRSAAVERAADAHDRFADLVVRGGGLEDVSAAVTDVLGGRLFTTDEMGRPLVPGGAAPDESAGIADVASRAHASGRTVRHERHAVAAVSAGAELLGALVLERDADLSESDQRILERAALVTALLLLIRRSVAEAQSRVRGELLEEIIASPERDPDQLRERARLVSADLDAEHAVCVVRVPGGGRDRAAAALGHLGAVRRGLSGRYGGGHVVCLPGQTAKAAAELVSRELGSALEGPVTVGAAGPAAGPAGIASCAVVAERCVQALIALGREGGSASAGELGFVGLLLGAERDVASFVDTTIGPLLDYDARRGTSLMSTVEQYFATGSSPARAAGQLHVHVNTVAQRLERVAALLGPTWQEPERALELQLAVRLHRISAAG